MSYQLISSGRQIFGGFAAPGYRPGEWSSRSDLVTFLRERMGDREPDGTVVNVLYIPDQRGAFNAMIAVARETPADVPMGDVFVELPPTTYAVFTPDFDLPDIVEDAWNQVEEAVAAGSLGRGIGTEFEAWTSPSDVEIYLPVLCV